MSVAAGLGLGSCGFDGQSAHQQVAKVSFIMDSVALQS